MIFNCIQFRLKKEQPLIGKNGHFHNVKTINNPDEINTQTTESYENKFKTHYSINLLYWLLKDKQTSPLNCLFNGKAKENQSIVKLVFNTYL